MKKIIIAAVSKNNVLGNDGKIPWRSKEELLNFKKITMGFPIIMGRKTWETLAKPLKDRLNVVITHDQNYSTNFHEVIVFFSVKQALDYFRTSIYEKIFIIGGGEIFKETINIVDKIILSVMEFEAEGDTFFPQIDESLWQLNSSEKYTDFTVHHYIRKQN